MKALELFAGAGGAALGMRQAGVEALACVEIEPPLDATTHTTTWITRRYALGANADEDKSSPATSKARLGLTTQNR